MPNLLASLVSLGVADGKKNMDLVSSQLQTDVAIQNSIITGFVSFLTTDRAPCQILTKTSPLFVSDSVCRDF